MPKSDIEIAREARLRPILDVGREVLGLTAEQLEPYGHYKAKVSLDVFQQRKDRPDGKLILVTAINPTPAGEGKTTTTVGLGATLAQVRGDRVIAVDANPDRGTLSDKVVLETSATVRDLLNERDQIQRYVDIRAFTSQAPSRLEILASDRDPSVSEAFSAADYQTIAQILENFYSICITDCGTGLLHSAMSGVLGMADQIVLVSSPSVDGARAASATLDWLEAHHYGDLVKAASVVLCSVRPRSKSTVDLDRLEAHFAARCREVVRVPYDPHLEEGAEIDLDRLQPATLDAYLRLAAAVGDGFAGPQY